MREDIQRIELPEDYVNTYTDYTSSYMLCRSGLKPVTYQVWMLFWLEYRRLRVNRGGELVYVLCQPLSNLAEKLDMKESSIRPHAKKLQEMGFLYQFKNFNGPSWWVPVDPSDRSYYIPTLRAIKLAKAERLRRKSMIVDVQVDIEPEVEERIYSMEELEELFTSDNASFRDLPINIQLRYFERPQQ